MSLVTTAISQRSRSARQSASVNAVLPDPTGPPMPTRSGCAIVKAFSTRSEIAACTESGDERVIAVDLEAGGGKRKGGGQRQRRPLRKLFGRFRVEELQRCSKLDQRRTHLFGLGAKLRRFPRRAEPAVPVVERVPVPTLGRVQQPPRHGGFARCYDEVEKIADPCGRRRRIAHDARLGCPLQSLRITVGTDRQGWTGELQKSNQRHRWANRGIDHPGAFRELFHERLRGRSAKSWITPACLASPECWWCPAAYAPGSGSNGAANADISTPRPRSISART